MNYISTRNNQINFSSEEVLNYGLAPDGGLFIPKEIPKFSIGDIKNLKNANYQDIAYFVLNPFLKDLKMKMVIGWILRVVLYCRIK